MRRDEKDFGEFAAVSSVIGLVSPALAAREGIKGKPQILPARPIFELGGTVVSAPVVPTFDVKIRSGGKSLRREGKRPGDTITLVTDEATSYRKRRGRRGKLIRRASFADLKYGLRVYVGGKIEKRDGVTKFLARRIIIIQPFK